MLSAKIAAETLTARYVRSVNTEKAAPESSIKSEGSAQDPTQINTAPSSVIGKREMVSWRKAADCVRLTGAQAAAVAEARTTVGARLTECALLQHAWRVRVRMSCRPPAPARHVCVRMKCGPPPSGRSPIGEHCFVIGRLAEHRKHLIASLNAFAAGPSDGGDLDTAVNASEQLQQNMAEEVTYIAIEPNCGLSVNVLHNQALCLTDIWHPFARRTPLRMNSSSGFWETC